MSLGLDEFEAGVGAALGPGVGREIGAIFRFIDRYPDDRSIVSTPFSVPFNFPPFEPISVGDWIALHEDAFSDSRHTI